MVSSQAILRANELVATPLEGQRKPRRSESKISLHAFLGRWRWSASNKTDQRLDVMVDIFGVQGA
jgi:hypothetical protein